MRTLFNLTLSAALLITVSCSPSSDQGEPEAAVTPEASSDAIPEEETEMTLGFTQAVLAPLGDSGVDGKVSFTAVPGGVRVEAHVNGLTPGNHGFHIHDVGDCSSADGSSAGGHFNPMAVDHAGPDADIAHVGDLGNLQANAEGHGMVTMISKRITLGDGTATDIAGRAVIVHADPDDLTSQPTGAAGGRVACGVIVSSN
jgi:Cu-Zn family superoxide dismutase